MLATVSIAQYFGLLDRETAFYYQALSFFWVFAVHIFVLRMWGTRAIPVYQYLPYWW